MTDDGLILKAVFLAISILGLFTVIKLWNAPSNDSSYDSRNYWGGDSLGRGYRRAWLPIVLVVAFLTVGLFIPSLMRIAAVGAFLVAAPLAATVVLFNRPKFLVPPGARHEKGLINEYLESRQ